MISKRSLRIISFPVGLTSKRNQPRVCFLNNFPSGRPRAGSVMRMSADIATTTDNDDKLVFHSEFVTSLQRNLFDGNLF